MLGSWFQHFQQVSALPAAVRGFDSFGGLFLRRQHFLLQRFFVLMFFFHRTLSTVLLTVAAPCPSVISKQTFFRRKHNLDVCAGE